MRSTALAFGLGTAGLGAVCLAFGDFALQWQPVPAGLPARTPLAYANGLVMAAAGLLVLIPSTQLRAARFLAVYFILWTLLLKVPKVIAAPATTLSWLGLAEIASLAAAAVTLALLLDPRPRPAGLRAARIVYGLCPLVFGLSHFVYARFTAEMVPGWLPAPLFWAYATGVGHVAAGLAILSGLLARLAATLLAAMMACFVLLLHLPRVVAAPASQVEWTMLFVATALAGAAWILRAGLSGPGSPASASAGRQARPA
ncbi:MAG TPA: DoxX family membrane protein [Allosphingosinicella sp.]|nr:DoxX family membrane protein [Allosphingosinicella sp.]